jgi:hypothetical protein
METVTIAEAAKRTGITPKAIARRVERGTLQAIVKDGKRRLPVEELDKLPRGTTDTTPVGEGNHGAAPLDLAHLVARLEILAAENMRLRLLTEHGESGREAVERELLEARARITQLEAVTQPRRRFWRSRKQAEVQPAA